MFTQCSGYIKEAIKDSSMGDQERNVRGNTTGDKGTRSRCFSYSLERSKQLSYPATAARYWSLSQNLVYLVRHFEICLVLNHYNWRTHGNVSQRIMLSVPRNSHRYFIDPLSDTNHITFPLFKRYIKSVDSIESSQNRSWEECFVRRDCRSNTGQNLRKLLRIDGKTRIDDLKGDFDDLIYNEIPIGEEWKIRLAEELIEMIKELWMSRLLRTSLLNVSKLLY